MGLRSKLLRGDSALEACLIHDASHVVTGAQGDHVAKIQTALELLMAAEIDPAEISAAKYGPSTADAVLAFKRDRRIINYSYQTHADNIVGKMTIAALDREILIREHRRTLSFGCGDRDRGGPGGGGTSEFLLVQTTGPDPGSPAGASSTFPADLDILWQPTAGAVARVGNKTLSLLAKAISLLKPYGIGIISSVTSPPDQPFPNTDTVDSNFRQDIFKVRKDAEKARPGFPKVLRIIPCPFEAHSTAYGVTEGGTLDGVTFPDFVLVNVTRTKKDECTVIHEMIHATGLWLKDHDSDPANVFSESNSRSVLTPNYAERLSKAYFARKK